MRRAVLSCALLCLAVLGVVRGPATHAATPAPAIDELLAAYSAGDFHVLRKAVTSGARFEELRKELGSTKDGQFRGAMQRWHPQRRPVHSAFMLELVLVGHQLGLSGWLDALTESRRFLVARPEAPGTSPEIDAFELTWHRAAIAILQGTRRPDLLDEHGIRPLAERITPGPATPGKLVAPWLALARGVTEEQWAQVPRVVAAVRYASALEHYTLAAADESTRREALVRKGRVLLAMDAPADAVAAFKAVEAEGTDTGVSYWRWLFLGRGYEALNQVTEAETAYERARAVLPDAQSANVALAALALRRDDPARAFQLTQVVRTAPADTPDPWWDYYTGEYRLLGPRMAALRRLAGK